MNNLEIGDKVHSELLNDFGTVLRKTKRTITIKWTNLTQKITFKNVGWDCSDWDYKKV